MMGIPLIGEAAKERSWRCESVADAGTTIELAGRSPTCDSPSADAPGDAGSIVRGQPSGLRLPFYGLHFLLLDIVDLTYAVRSGPSSARYESTERGWSSNFCTMSSISSGVSVFSRWRMRSASVWRSANTSSAVLLLAGVAAIGVDDVSMVESVPLVTEFIIDVAGGSRLILSIDRFVRRGRCCGVTIVVGDMSLLLGPPPGGAMFICVRFAADLKRAWP